MKIKMKAKSKPAKKPKTQQPSASKYKSNKVKNNANHHPKHKDDGNHQVFGLRAALHLSLPSLSEIGQPAIRIINGLSNDGKNSHLILGVSIVANILILSSATTLFILSATCNTPDTDTGGVVVGSSPDSSNSPLPPMPGYSPFPALSPSPPPMPGYSPFPALSPSPPPMPGPSGLISPPEAKPVLTKFDTITNPNHQCGVSNVQPDLKKGRIVGGAEAIPNSWPFTVGIGTARLQSGNQMSITQSCGGTLISPRHALTAAHCFIGDPRCTNTYSIFAAVHSTATYKGFRPMRVAVVRFHPKTNAFTEEKWVVYDFALLTLYKEFTPSTKIQIACLPTVRKVLPEGTLCWATGWGRTQGTGDENVLNQVVIDVVSEQTCQKLYNSGIKMKSTLCGGTTPRKDTCQGDSGGPLFHQEYGKWILYGVTSYGAADCGSGPMAAYGAVSFNVEWICCFMSNIPRCNGIKCVPSGES